MTPAAAVASPPRRLRTITPPPPILDWAREVASLEEAGPELAVAFWRVLRKVRAWAETPPEERAALFGIDKRQACERLGCACGLAPALVEAFGTFSLLVRAPGKVEPRQLAEACHQVHEWAEERSFIQVAMLFAEAAAFADPDDPAWANDAGRMCRRAARDERAASWYHRGYGLGARLNNPAEVIRAQLGYGGLMYHLGQHAEARRYYEKAATRANYSGRRRQAAEAKHDLLAIASDVGSFEEGERQARGALKLYPTNHPRIPYLVHDIAFLFVQNRLYSSALPLLSRVRPLIYRPGDQVLVGSTIARAAAGTGQSHTFWEIAKEVVSASSKYPEHAPAALRNLADGAWLCGEWEHAEQFAHRALEAARARKEGEPERRTTALLEQIALRSAPPPEEEPRCGSLVEQISRRCIARLKKWKAPDRERSGADREPEAPCNDDSLIS